MILPAIATLLAGGSAYMVYSIYRHEQRSLKVGSVAVKEEDVQNPSFQAVVDNYVYIHNAFRNHLKSIRMACERGQDISGELRKWVDILNLHSRVEDELLIPALQARLKNNEEKKIPANILSGKDHDEVKEHIESIFAMDEDKKAMIHKLKDLEIVLDQHLVHEEKYIMPLMMEAFSTRELWALDSFIINPKLGYCDNDMLMTVTKWWFGNLSIKEWWPLLKNFVAAGNQPPMSLEDWKKIQDIIPALSKFPTEDLIP